MTRSTNDPGSCGIEVSDCGRSTRRVVGVPQTTAELPLHSLTGVTSVTSSASVTTQPCGRPRIRRHAHGIRVDLLSPESRPRSKQPRSRLAATGSNRVEVIAFRVGCVERDRTTHACAAYRPTCTPFQRAETGEAAVQQSCSFEPPADSSVTLASRSPRRPRVEVERVSSHRRRLSCTGKFLGFRQV